MSTKKPILIVLMIMAKVMKIIAQITMNQVTVTNNYVFNRPYYFFPAIELDTDINVPRYEENRTALTTRDNNLKQRLAVINLLKSLLFENVFVLFVGRSKSS